MNEAPTVVPPPPSQTLPPPPEYPALVEGTMGLAELVRTILAELEP